MNFRHLLFIGFAGLAACGGGDEQTLITPTDPQTGEAITGPASLVYSYPMDGQRNVSPVADVVLRFNVPVSLDSAKENIEIVGADGAIGFTARSVDDGRSIILDPETELSLGFEHTVRFLEPLETVDGRLIDNPQSTLNSQPGIQFHTRAGLTGIAELDSTDSDFSIASMIPDAGTAFEPADLSAFRLELTQPVHPDWQALGGEIQLLDQNGNVITSDVLVKDRRITVDPCVTDQLDTCGSPDDKLVAGGSYQLSLSNLPSITGERLTTTRTFVARATEPTAVQFQNATDPAQGDELLTSKLNGQVVNGVILNSVLQGTTERSTSLGALFTELAFAPSFAADEALPLRVPRGTRLIGSSLPVKINGTVPIIDENTGELQETGDINVVMVSDATGFLMPNAYTSNQNAPRHVRLFMDVAMNTEEAQPNAALSQDLLHVELVGIALVEDGILVIDAIGIVEPNLLGQEVADSTIAFQILADTSVDTQLQALNERSVDVEGPELVSWMPGDNNAFPGNRVQMHRPGDPITLNFNEPVLRSSVANGIRLIDNTGASIAGTKMVDGTTVTINPDGGLRHGVPYSVQVTSDLTDLAGNSSASFSLEFELPELGDSDEVPVASPIPLTTYPGYPCVTTGLSLADDSHGKCIDAAPDGPRGDELPITPLPSDRPIVVVFSQSMDADSIELGSSFLVQQLDDQGNAVADVEGRLEFSNQRIRFFPDEPWQPGVYYRYTLASSQNGNCDQESIICSELGLPLQTDLLVDPEDVGGPNLEIVFKGEAATTAVYTPLRNLPVRDTNSNLVVDCDSLSSQDCLEPFNHELEAPGSSEYKPSPNAAKLLVTGGSASVLGIPVGATVGCEPGNDCPENKFIYQTYALNTDVVGPLNPQEEGEDIVDIILYPTQLGTTSASVFLQGLGEQATGPQIIRMRYQEPTEDNPVGYLRGEIYEDEEGKTRFRTVAPLLLDAPNLSLPAAQLLSHDLYSKPIELDLDGPVQFFDDGRMQVSLISQKAVDLSVNVNVRIPVLSDLPLIGDLIEAINGLGAGAGNLIGGLACLVDPACDAPETAEGVVSIPLQIPAGGINLNFISFPIKQIPEAHNNKL